MEKFWRQALSNNWGPFEVFFKSFLISSWSSKLWHRCEIPKNLPVQKILPFLLIVQSKISGWLLAFISNYPKTFQLIFFFENSFTNLRTFREPWIIFTGNPIVLGISFHYYKDLSIYKGTPWKNLYSTIDFEIFLNLYWV